MLAGADLYHLRVDLEKRIEDRLRQSEAVQDERLLVTLREEVRRELNDEFERWTQELMDRMDVLFGAWSRIVSTLEDRIDQLERRTQQAERVVNGRAPHPAEVEANGSTGGR